ncbi:asparagine synthase-related protein, partial [Halobium palmae]
MTGIIGATAGAATAESMADSMFREPWYETEATGNEGGSVGTVRHGDRDPRSNTVWSTDSAVAVLDGVVSNLGALGWDRDELVGRLLDDPDGTLPELEGPFTVAVVEDDGDVLLATDVAGSRPCYYVPTGGFAFASELTPLLSRLDDVDVDVREVVDLLAYGSVVGEKTLVEGIDTLPPSMYLRYEDGEVRTERYWYPTFETDEATYVDEWIRRHDRSVERVADTVDGPLGLWLSGGLDSRVTAGTLGRVGREFETFTYATGEPGTRKAVRETAATLGVRNREVSVAEIPSEELIRGFETTVDCLDAMLSFGLGPAIAVMARDIRDEVDVVSEGGTYLAEDVFAYFVENDVTPVEMLRRSRTKLQPATVQSIVTEPVDPLDSLREHVAHCPPTTPGNQCADAVRRFYGYLHMRSNTIQRSQLGTRQLSPPSFLDHVVSMPLEQRVETLPFTDGAVPLAVPPLKLAVVRRIDDGLEDIPYERTGLAPASARWQHVLGFGTKEVVKRLRPSGQSNGIARIQRDDAFRSYLTALADDAGGRPFLD